jgi:hypothetical protein
MRFSTVVRKSSGAVARSGRKEVSYAASALTVALAILLNVSSASRLY